MAEELSGRDDADSQLIARWQGAMKGRPQRLWSAMRMRWPAMSAAWASATQLKVVQDTFVRAFASIESFRGESSLNLVVHDCATAGGGPAAIGAPAARGGNLDDVDASTHVNALDHLIGSEAQQRVWAAVGKLSPTQREVFLLRVNEGLSYKEIAEVASTTEGAARVHYHNALRTVKENLND